MIKIRTQTEKHKGYIPWDKLRKFGLPFEDAGLAHLIGEEAALKLKNATVQATKSLRLAENDATANAAKEVLKVTKKIAKVLLLKSAKVKEAASLGHSMLYLNFNADGIDCFISRDATKHIWDL